jgi:hypothetical protein
MELHVTSVTKPNNIKEKLVSAVMMCVWFTLDATNRAAFWANQSSLPNRIADSSSGFVFFREYLAHLSFVVSSIGRIIFMPSPHRSILLLPMFGVINSGTSPIFQSPFFEVIRMIRPPFFIDGSAFFFSHGLSIT